MRHLIFGTVLCAASSIALAQQNGVQIDNAWSRPAMAGRIGVVYLTITDTSAPDKLVGAESPIAAKADMHESFSDNGVAKMRDVATLPVQPGKSVTLAPGGFHIMLTGLKQALQPGDTFPLTLRFEKRGQVTTTVTVQKAGSSMPAGHDAMGGMNMPGMQMPGDGKTK